MRMLTAIAALALVAGAPLTAEAQNGNGNGNGNGRGHETRQDNDRGRGGDRDRGDRGDRGGGRENRGDRQDRAERRIEKAERRADREIDRMERRIEAQADRTDRRVERAREDARERFERRVERPVIVRDGRSADIVYFRAAPDRGLIAGCPPGLARKNNGCLPPGQARRIERARYENLWRAYYPQDAGRYTYRYDDGYVYRMNSQGGLMGYLPVLGGALGLGNVWPTQYRYEAPPTYYSDYYRLQDGYDYRYSDGVLYGVNPQNQAISSVAALLTGQTMNVGQRLPAGYDVYNVPYAYRGQYADSQDAWYRYNDGYVYQVDPTTRLIQAIFQLLA